MLFHIVQGDCVGKRKTIVLDYKASAFDPKEYESKVLSELKNNRPINALFLIHGYLEFYLSEWLFMMSHKPKSEFSDNIIKEVQNAGFKNLLNAHLIIGNIDETLYKKIECLNDYRNEIAHNFTRINLTNERNCKKWETIVKKGIEFCKEVSEKYLEKANERATKFEEYLKCPKCKSKMEYFSKNENMYPDSDGAPTAIKVTYGAKCSKCGGVEIFEQGIETI
jgi:hypothetical protein